MILELQDEWNQYLGNSFLKKDNLETLNANKARKVKKRVLCGYGVDIDAVAGWLGSYGGEDSTSDISRGLFAGTLGVCRILKLFEKNNIKATWFIPGHSLETFPEECAMVRNAGHEIGLHGYSHENPVDMTLEQQQDVLDKTYRLLTEFCGKPPRGSVAPWWETSKEGAELLLSYGIEYDHSMSHDDCQMYWLRLGDTWTKIDYSKKSRRVDETAYQRCPLWYGGNSSLMIISTIFYENYDEFVFPMTIHPDVSGRPHALKMQQRIIDHINKHDGVEWVTFEQMSDDFKSKNKPEAGAIMPAVPGEILKR
ncbi:hypothetical protein EYC84_010447 [Monilinia fructicola]|uniref:NodB homology domain-containing protein n=1 Tax=Monilinia fructicola TaxID=38448 RepID=A0A5M9JFL0_MONFR|nr:hypothetical protein EYC84_010447 [Monilinia fructicola]